MKKFKKPILLLLTLSILFAFNLSTFASDENKTVSNVCTTECEHEHALSAISLTATCTHPRSLHLSDSWVTVGCTKQYVRTEQCYVCNTVYSTILSSVTQHTYSPSAIPGHEGYCLKCGYFAGY